jgi:hypothetical protein
MIRFLLDRIRGRRTPVNVRSHRELTLPVDVQTARGRARRAIEEVLGANVYAEEAGWIDAGFGLVNQERITVSFEAVTHVQTRVVIEARYPAALSRPERSRAVEALADALEAGVGP